MTHNDKLIKGHIEALERAGYVIKKRTKSVKTHTFIIDVELLAIFKAEAKKRSVTLRTALADAIKAWLDKPVSK